MDFISNSLHLGLFFCFGLVVGSSEKKKKEWSLLLLLENLKHDNYPGSQALCKEDHKEQGLFIAYI